MHRPVGGERVDDFAEYARQPGAVGELPDGYQSRTRIQNQLPWYSIGE